MTAGAEFERLDADHAWAISEHLSDEAGVWVTASTEASVSYSEGGHANLVSSEDASFWFRTRAEAIVAAFSRHGDRSCVWEIGAGNGHVAASLQAAGIPAVAVEPGPVGIVNAHRRGVPAIRGVLGDLQLPSGSLGAAGMFDVLEHLEDPASLLAELKRVLRSGGLLAVTVPSYTWLWSDKDMVAGHFRRYSRRSLDEELGENGFDRVESRYLFPSLVVPMALRYRLPFLLRGPAPDQSVAARVARDLGTPRALHAILSALFSAESRLTRAVRVPFGTSILGVYRTP